MFTVFVMKKNPAQLLRLFSSALKKLAYEETLTIHKNTYVWPFLGQNFDFVENGHCVEKLEMRIQNFAFQIELCCRPFVFLKVLSLQLIDDHLDT